MGRKIDSLEFLDAVAGYARRPSKSNPQARRNRLATVDAAYTTGLPKVTFDGESTLSGKAYPHLDSYTPTAGDRVVLIPAGTTYVIVGAVA